MSFRPGGFESDDDDFIDFGDYAPDRGPPPLSSDSSPSTRVDHETEDRGVGCEDEEDERRAGEPGDAVREVRNGSRWVCGVRAEREGLKVQAWNIVVR